MRTIVGRAVAASALAVIAITPLAGTASASTVQQKAPSTAVLGHCRNDHGPRCCEDRP
ncbi:hypothetical protein HNQ79_004248 [Streptomyces candidus]|uniref:Uncharacterized protein n=1 Tax=Streptomyces candidus TaxID=67283 RepID=A0A7X0LRQ9_9ACTN|nr:hypothetical protein [Streptomyces candidus]